MKRSMTALTVALVLGLAAPAFAQTEAPAVDATDKAMTSDTAPAADTTKATGKKHHGKKHHGAHRAKTTEEAKTIGGSGGKKHHGKKHHAKAGASAPAESVAPEAPAAGQ